MTAPRDHYLGDWLRASREEARLRRIDLAPRIGVSEKTLYIWETRGWVPRVALGQIALALGKDPGEIPGYSPPAPASEPTGLFNRPLLMRIVEQLEQAEHNGRDVRPLLEELSAEVSALSELLRDLAARRAADSPRG